MTSSKHIAGLIGPTLIALILSENKFVNPHLYDSQIPPVVYLSGALFFVAGVAIVRAHNRWTVSWPVLVTLTGWFAILLGSFRMLAPAFYEQGAQGNPTGFLTGETALLAIGIFLTLKGYGRGSSPRAIDQGPEKAK
ncbi:MAG TPA: hypothetical protein VGJ80_03795 [Gemmatimonadales bacterium]|jgi:hypothetical protein